MPSSARPGPLSLPLAGGARLVATAERGPDPSGRWYWRVRHHGEGARPTVTEQVLGASAWATEADVGRAMAVWVTSATPLKPAAWTVRHLLEQWLTTYVQRERLSPQTRALAEQTCTALSLQGGRLLDLRLDEVTTGHLEDLAETWRRADGRARELSTVRLGLSLIRQAWRWALARRMVDVVVPVFPPLRESKPKHKTRATREDVLAVLERLRLPWHRAAVHLLWARGLRPGELRRLRVRDWRPGQDLLRVRGGKTGDRDVPLGRATDAGRALSELAAGKTPDASIWPVSNPGQAIRFALASACEAAGVDHLSPVAFRRAVVDRLYDLDGDPTAAGAIVGHSPTTALLYRSRVKQSAVQRAAAALDADRLPEGKLIAIGDRRPQPRPQAPTGDGDEQD